MHTNLFIKDVFVLQLLGKLSFFYALRVIWELDASILHAHLPSFLELDI
jgi:hypothetical protein